MCAFLRYHDLCVGVFFSSPCIHYDYAGRDHGLKTIFLDYSGLEVVKNKCRHGSVVADYNYCV